MLLEKIHLLDEKMKIREHDRERNRERYRNDRDYRERKKTSAKKWYQQNKEKRSKINRERHLTTRRKNKCESMENIGVIKWKKKFQTIFIHQHITE